MVQTSALPKPSSVSAPFAAPQRPVTGALKDKVLADINVLGRQHETQGPGRVVFYQGERIDFRPIELADEPLLRRWINDPMIRRGLRFHGPINESHEREWIQSLGKAREDYCLGMVVRAEDRLIGTVGLHQVDPIARQATLGISIGERAYHNRGYGTEAVKLILRFGFEELNLHRIQLSVLANNIRAIRCYQKAGFVQEGCRRDHFFRHGQYVDEYLFAVLREEWAARKGGAG